MNLIDVKAGKLDGAWELSDNQMELRFRHLPPSKELNLTINPGIKAVNERTTTENFEKKIDHCTNHPNRWFCKQRLFIT
ncbi:hypothetical protein J4727_15290 [Providencia rettgeri]|uniref:Alpha-2-macroglobulin MG1 domain-containing protein n=1 Tax=Providencia rettgeri TaxID=587 RepID=A0A939SJH9_PRORE|nr:hypothetical protein [Providencia rettgeri]